MKHTTSPLALEIGRKQGARIRQPSVHESTSKPLDARVWLPNASPDELCECSKLSCARRFLLRDGFAYPFNFVRSVDEHGMPTISRFPILIFCSLEHVLATSIAAGSRVTEDGDIKSIHH